MSKVVWDNPVAGAKWVRTWRLGEWLSDPVSPLFETLVIPTLAMAREVGGTKHLGWRLPPGWHLREPWFCVVNGYFFARADFSLPSFIRFLTFDVPRMEKAIARWHQVNLPQYFERLERLRAFDLEHATPTGVLGHVEDLCQDAAAWWHLISLDAGGSSFMEQMFRSIYQRLLRDGPPAEEFLKGLDSPQMAGEQYLHTLVTQAKHDSVLRSAFEQEDPKRVLIELETSPRGCAFLSDLDSYLEAYGHQVINLDILFPTPQEDPTSLVLLMQKMIAAEIPDSSERVAMVVARRERAEHELAQQLASSPLRKRVIEGLLKRSLELARRRETTVFSFQRGWPLLRRSVLELGRRLAAKGIIDQAVDIFFLTKDEVWDSVLESEQSAAPARLKAQARDRREQWEWQRTLSPPDRIPPGDDPIWKGHRGPAFWGEGRHDKTQERERLIGQSASLGYAKGPARILRSPADFQRFQRGDILVAVTTTPVWTLLFALAAAVVTESGGITSHASIVAREYGIPAVVATGCATSVIQNGQTVEVDGNRGIVYLHQ